MKHCKCSFYCQLLTKASNLQSTVLAHVHPAALNLQNQAKSVKPAKYRELMMVISYVLVEASLLTSSDSLVGPYLGSAVWKQNIFPHCCHLTELVGRGCTNTTVYTCCLSRLPANNETGSVLSYAVDLLRSCTTEILLIA